VRVGGGVKSSSKSSARTTAAAASNASSITALFIAKLRLFKREVVWGRKERSRSGEETFEDERVIEMDDAWV
jgi:hypothetical protein